MVLQSVSKDVFMWVINHLKPVLQSLRSGYELSEILHEPGNKFTTVPTSNLELSELNGLLKPTALWWILFVSVWYSHQLYTLYSNSFILCEWIMWQTVSRFFWTLNFRVSGHLMLMYFLCLLNAKLWNQSQIKWYKG